MPPPLYRFTQSHRVWTSTPASPAIPARDSSPSITRAMARSRWRQSRNLFFDASSRRSSGVWSVRETMTFAGMPSSFCILPNTEYRTSAPITRNIPGRTTSCARFVHPHRT